MRVLLVEDSKRLVQAVSTGLRKAGYAVDVAMDGEEGLWYAESNEYDVIVLDLMLPKLDGLSVLQCLREKGKTSHVLVLTARDSVEDRVRGLQAGADDYLVKPFAFEELLARVQALGRRAHGTKTSEISIGDLVIDLSSRTVTCGVSPIALRPREYALLEFLALHKGQVVSRNEIEDHIYDERTEPMSNVVDATVYAVRRKLARSGRESIIKTRRGMGYIIVDVDT